MSEPGQYRLRISSRMQRKRRPSRRYTEHRPSGPGRRQRCGNGAWLDWAVLVAVAVVFFGGGIGAGYLLHRGNSVTEKLGVPTKANTMFTAVAGTLTLSDSSRRSWTTARRVLAAADMTTSPVVHRS